MGGSAMSVGGEPRRRRGREPAGCGGVNQGDPLSLALYNAMQLQAKQTNPVADLHWERREGGEILIDYNYLPSGKVHFLVKVYWKCVISG